MKFLHQIYLKQYIYSPKTIYHRINHFIKVYSIYNLLLTIIYVNNNHMMLIICMIFIIILQYILYSNIQLSEISHIKDNTYYLLYILILNGITEDNYNNYNYIFKYELFIPYHFLLNIDNHQFKLKYYHLLYIIPKHLVKLTSMYIISLNLINILFLCTEYQIVFELLINYFNKIYLLLKVKCNKYIINLFLGYQSLENITITLINTYTGIQIKGLSLFTFSTINVIIIFNMYYNYILSLNYLNSLMSWNRNIKNKSLEKLRFNS